MKDTDPGKLHPIMRERAAALDAAIASAGLPLRRYESYRGPARQALLYAQGRAPGIGTPGRYVTKARPWTSLHQYGLATDWVFFVDGGWTWAEPEAGMWERFGELMMAADLEPLSFERPHAQVPLAPLGLSLADLAAGQLPLGGDASYLDNLHAEIKAWGSAPRTLYTLPLPPAPPWSGPPPDCGRPPLG